MKDETKSKKRLTAELNEARRRISELEDESRTLQSLIDAAPVSIAILDRGGTVKMWNRASETIFGWKEEEVLGVYLPTVPESRAEEFLALTDFVAGGNSVSDIEVRRRRKDGSPVDLSLSMSPLRNGAGDIVGIVRIMVDITERKRAERRLALQYAVTRILSESSSLDAAAPKILEAVCKCLDWEAAEFWLVDHQAGLLRCIETWHKLSASVEEFETLCRRTAFARGEGLPGCVWAEGEPISIDDVTKEPNYSRSQIAEKEGLHAALAFPVLLKDEVIGVIEFYSNEIRKTDKDVLDMLTAVSSQLGQFIERKRAEEKQAELQQSLRRSEMTSALGALIAAVAHDVRNPLFSMTAVLDAFEEGFRDREEYKEYTSILRSDMERLSALMGELLEYGKPQNENISMGYIEPIIEQAMQASTLLAKRLKVNMEKKIAAKLPTLSMDRTRVFQIFQNLLDNALRHSPAGSVVVIEAEEILQDERVWIECRVKDSGTGFRPEDLPKIYEPFFTRRRGGTGLGLSIVQRIAEQHGGNVAAANRPEGGAVVAVRFPAAVE